MHPQKKREILRGLRSFHKAQNRKIRYLPLVSVNTHANHPALPQNCAIMWVILTTSPAPSIHSRETTQGSGHPANFSDCYHSGLSFQIGLEHQTSLKQPTTLSRILSDSLLVCKLSPFRFVMYSWLVLDSLQSNI